MELFTTDVDENYTILKFTSTNNKWEIGIRPMLYGVRVCGGRGGVSSLGLSRSYDFDYCAGNNPVFAIDLLQIMLIIFGGLPEEITEKEVKRILPTYSVKPIDRDPTCWQELKKLAVSLN
jgi:hypothetical protein